MTDDALAIHDDDRPAAGAAFLAPQTVLLRYLALGVKVSQQRKGEATQLLGEGLMRMHAVHADAQNLGIELLEPPVILGQLRKLNSSSFSEVQNVKSQHHDLAAQIGKGEWRSAAAGREGKVGREVADCYRFVCQRNVLSNEKFGASVVSDFGT